ncbi:rod shape-determining protein MreC [Virgibacillus siamensis]|uniref:Cell shape-determining protein MreC n=1 Tax=Virgibacillus siamensis TaxID=480071 RepID=A0ABP3R5J2_9BACI
MPFFQKKRLFILLIGIIVLVALIGYSLQDKRNLTTPEQFIKDTVGWAQSVIHTPVNFVTNIFTNIDDLKDTFEENKVLRNKLAQYKTLIFEVQELKKENKELRKMLDKTESGSIRDFNPIQATVLSRSPERWIEHVTINKGKQDGVRENMAVVTAGGMIGKIQSASQFTSTVQLLTGFDQFNRISATISRKKGNDVFGLIQGFDKESGNLLFKVIEESEKNLKEGEKVVSSGMGGVFPAGLFIGTVQEVKPDKYGLTKTALVKPAADMYEINNVIVVDRVLEEHESSNQSGEEEE